MMESIKYFQLFLTDMLEKAIKSIGSKITAIVLAGYLMPNAGCSMYKTISPEDIQPVKPIEKHLNGQVKAPIDYSKLTWQEAIEQVQTPEQAQDYLNKHLFYEESGHYDSFKINHSDRHGVCLDYATAAAALLSDNNYQPLILEMNDGEKYSHVVFVYKLDGEYFALGNSPLARGYLSIDGLIKGLNQKYGKAYCNYFIFDLNANYKTEWMNKDKPIKLKRTGIFDIIPVK